MPKEFATRIRKVEPIGGDCVRIYFSIERDGAWDDRFAVEMPMGPAMEGCKFIMQSIDEIHNESQWVFPEDAGAPKH